MRHAAIGFGRELAKRDDGVTMAWWKEERGERIFVDYNQNNRDRTIASAYSLRPIPGAPVSTPMTWEELAGVTDPGEYNLFTVPDRAGRRRPVGRDRRRPPRHHAAAGPVRGAGRPSSSTTRPTTRRCPASRRACSRRRRSPSTGTRTGTGSGRREWPSGTRGRGPRRGDRLRGVPVVLPRVDRRGGAGPVAGRAADVPRLASGWTPIELLSHVLHMERRWFVWGFLGEQVADPWGDWSRDEPWDGPEDGPEPRWQVPADVTAESLAERLREVGARTTQVLAEHDLDEVPPPSLRWDHTDGTPPLRWICFHVLARVRPPRRPPRHRGRAGRRLAEPGAGVEEQDRGGGGHVERVGACRASGSRCG